MSYCRSIAAAKLWSARDNPEGINQVKAWVEAMGTSRHGRHHGLLFPEEIEAVLDHGLNFPLPWTFRQSQREVPEKYESSVGLFDISIPSWAEQGYVIGLAKRLPTPNRLDNLSTVI